MAGTFGSRLRQARKAARMSGPDLAKAIGVSNQTVSEWERDLYQPRGERLTALARLTHVRVDWLLSGNGTELPVLGGGRLVPKIALDELSIFDPRVTDTSEKERVLSHFPCGSYSFQVTLKDNSNAPRFLPGDSVIIDPELEPNPGDMVLVVVGKTPHFRKYKPRGKQLDLEPLNPDWEVVRCTIGKDAVLLGAMSEHTQPRR